jgi:hypothetical protein
MPARNHDVAQPATWQLLTAADTCETAAETSLQSTCDAAALLTQHVLSSAAAAAADMGQPPSRKHCCMPTILLLHIMASTEDKTK